MSAFAAGVRVGLVVGIATALMLLGGALPATANPAGTGLVISQVYGGGGNTGATYTNDFIEIFNPTASAIPVTGWSVQYGSSGGTTWTNQTPLSGSVPARGYYLVQEAAGAGGTTPLPTPNATGSITMSATAGKVALVNNTTALTGTGCPLAASVVDFVGYGAANCAEGTAAPGLSNTTADLRGNDGCTDTDLNSADFATGAPSPRNSSSPLKTCPVGVGLSVNDVTVNEGNAGPTSFDFTVSLSAPAGPGGVTFDIATGNGSAIEPGDYTATSLTGQTIPATSTTYTFSVLVNGDTSFEPNETFFVNVTNVTGATVTDGQGLGTITDDDIGACADPYTSVHTIQGSGPSAAVTGDLVTRGVVVGDFEGSDGLQGFYLQEPAPDADPATSEGIFVFTGGANLVSAGQIVRVRGFARERFGMTALNGANSDTAAVTAATIAACGTGSVSPTDVTMPFSALDYPERFEAMLVRLPQSLVISEYFNYERFGELVLALPLPGETRPFTPTAIVEPGAPAQARALANSLSRITLDDGLGIPNPNAVRHPNGSDFSLTNRFRGGDTVQNTVGVLSFDFSLYRIQPTGPATYTAVNPRPAAPQDVGGGLRVAAMNTLNFFLTPDYPNTPPNPLDNKCAPSQTMECRGHDFDQPSEFTRQRDKLLAALAGLDGDVIGLNEIENTPGVDPLGDPANGIVAGLNAIFGPGAYDYVDTGVIGTDAIRVGLVYRPAAVTPVGPFKLLTTAVDPRFIDTRSRPVLAQTFEENATGARFTVAVNHLKSKGSACTGAPLDDPDTGDGQGNCNLTRTQAAQALVDWLAKDPTGSGDPDFLIVGDLNSYAMEDPIDAIKAGPDDIPGTGDDYTNLVAQHLGPYAYSYVFDGQAGYLDHALSSSNLTPQVTGVAEWHINADEPDIFDYDTSFKPPAQDALYEPNAYRSSDHDPILVGLNLAVQCAGEEATITGSGTIVGTKGRDVIVGSGGNDTISGLGGDDLICGGLGNDWIDGGSGNDTIFGDSAASFGNMAAPGGDDTILGGSGDDQIIGEAGADTIDAGNGNDFATGNVGADTVSGGNGNDQLFGGTGPDVVNGGNGDDSLFGTFGDDTLNGGNGDDFLDGDLPPDMDVGGGPGVDPTAGNNDACNGGKGHDEAFGCESQTSVEVVIASF